MDVKTILKIHLQQDQMNIFHQVCQCLQYGHLKAQKISVIYAEVVKTAWTINFKEKKIKLLTNEQQESYKNSKICYICIEKFEVEYAKNKTCHYTVEYSGAAYSICYLKHIVSKTISMAFHNKSNYE